MKEDNEVLGVRTKVAKNPKLKKLNDKILFLGLILICLGIGLSGLIHPKKISSVFMAESKEDNSQQLDRNMALIASMRANNGIARDGNHPPKLRTLPSTESLTKETLARMNAPSTFFSISGGETQSPLKNQGPNKTLSGQDSNAQFLNQQNDIASVSAKKLPHPRLTVPAGEMIPATLETAIHSELAGMVRALTTRDVYALSGGEVLIPKGSTLVGQFNTAITQGQSRIFVVWNRLQMSNGTIVTLNSPSSDSIGRSGQAADYIDRHFFERFGSGALLSVLGAYTALGGVRGQDEYNSMSQYRMNIAGSFQQAANQTLQQDMQTRPTLQVNQGTAINIFVAHDLDFYRVAGR